MKTTTTVRPCRRPPHTRSPGIPSGIRSLAVFERSMAAYKRRSRSVRSADRQGRRPDVHGDHHRRVDGRHHTIGRSHIPDRVASPAT